MRQEHIDFVANFTFAIFANYFVNNFLGMRDNTGNIEYTPVQRLPVFMLFVGGAMFLGIRNRDVRALGFAAGGVAVCFYQIGSALLEQNDNPGVPAMNAFHN